MMPFGAHETMEVHEILNEKVNLINHFSLYMNQCSNVELKNMIERHLQAAVQSYDRLIAYTHDYSAASQAAPSWPNQTANVQPQQIEYGLRQPSPVTPQMHGNLNDVQIAWAVLLCHKNSAKNQMAAALECADPNVRQMLQDGANACAHQAYEVFLWMNRQGQYQVPTIQDHTAKTFLHSYQPAQPQMQTSYGQQAQQPVHPYA